MNIGKEAVLLVWDYRMHELEEESLIEDESDDPGKLLFSSCPSHGYFEMHGFSKGKCKPNDTSYCSR